MASTPKPVSDSKTQIWLAVIGVVSALGIAVISNWKTLFPPPEPQPQAPQTVQQTAPPTATTSPPKAPVLKPATVFLPASEFTNGSGVAMATGEVARYGNVLMNEGPPYIDRPNSANFQFRVPVAGTYQMWVEYAAAEGRPVTIELNDEIVTRNGLSARTGCWEPSCQQFLNQGEVKLRLSSNILRLSRSSVFPHIRAIKFVPVE